MTLRELLDALDAADDAARQGVWIVTSETERALFYMSRDLGRLLLDMADALGAILNHEERYSFDEIEALLARLDRIGSGSA